MGTLGRKDRAPHLQTHCAQCSTIHAQPHTMEMRALLLDESDNWGKKRCPRPRGPTTGRCEFRDLRRSRFCWSGLWETAGRRPHFTTRPSRRCRGCGIEENLRRMKAEANDYEDDATASRTGSSNGNQDVLHGNGSTHACRVGPSVKVFRKTNPSRTYEGFAPKGWCISVHTHKTVNTACSLGVGNCCCGCGERAAQHVYWDNLFMRIEMRFLPSKMVMLRPVQLHSTNHG